jgi:hypothetical protein
MGGRNEEGERSQPFMMPPFVTFNVMLARVLRFDLCRQQNSTVDTTYSYGCLRGLEFIPTTRLEFGIFEPDYMVHSANVPNGFSDFTYSVKFRAFSRPIGEGGYFVGFFLGGTAPTGGIPNGIGHPTQTPTFAVAKVLDSLMFRPRSAEPFPRVAPNSWAGACFSTPPSTIGSKKKSGSWSSRTLHFGLTAL